jgi:hypothetical protein
MLVSSNSCSTSLQSSEEHLQHARQCLRLDVAQTRREAARDQHAHQVLHLLLVARASVESLRHEMLLLQRHHAADDQAGDLKNGLEDEDNHMLTFGRVGGQKSARRGRRFWLSTTGTCGTQGIGALSMQPSWTLSLQSKGWRSGRNQSLVELTCALLALPAADRLLADSARGQQGSDGGEVVSALLDHAAASPRLPESSDRWARPES